MAHLVESPSNSPAAQADPAFPSVMAMLEEAVVAVAKCNWAEAFPMWTDIHRHASAPILSSLILYEVSVRCGKVKDIEPLRQAVETLASESAHYKKQQDLQSLIASRQSALGKFLHGNLDRGGLVQLGRRLVEAYMWNEALALWTELRARAPENDECLRRLFQCHFGLGAYARCVSLAPQLAREPTDAKLDERITKAELLEGRQRDGFEKNYTRFMKHPAVSLLHHIQFNPPTIGDPASELELLRSLRFKRLAASPESGRAQSSDRSVAATLRDALKKRPPDGARLRSNPFSLPPREAALVDDEIDEDLLL